MNGPISGTSLTDGECAQSALKDLVCILKQMGLHSEATTTIVQYRAAWPEVGSIGPLVHLMIHSFWSTGPFIVAFIRSIHSVHS